MHTKLHQNARRSRRKLLTHEQARAEFNRKGISVAQWARENDFGRSLVYEVLSGRKRCLRGDSHRIAVLLGLKAGEVV